MNISQRTPAVKGWKTKYKDKLASPEQAAGLIKSGDNLVLPNGYTGIISRYIAARQTELKDVRVEICTAVNDPGWLTEGAQDSFNVIMRIFLYAARPAHDEGLVEFLPFTNGTWAKTYRDNRPAAKDIDVFIIEVSPPDENGYCYFGNGVWESKYHAKKAAIVIAECDEYFIKTYGDSSLHVSELDCLVDVTEEPLSGDEIEIVAARLPEDKHPQARKVLAKMRARFMRNVIPIIDEVPVDILENTLNVDEPTDTMKGMAANLKTILKDADTIQIGIGKHTKHLVELGTFDGLNDLGIFSEMACPGMGLLVARGIVTNKYTTLHPGISVFSSLSGSSVLDMDYLHDNPKFELYPGDYVLDISNICQNDNQVAINNAVQVDMTGQITCESQFGPRLINGAGGQIEFHIGAFMSKNGRAVTMLPSTYMNGASSNIVPYFEKGTLVTLSRYWADYVVTEYGVAELNGKTHRERAEALVEVAHPDFREELADAAREFF